MLFGGKGSGKSTFTNRLLYHHPPNAIKHFARIAIVDLLECPETQEKIDQEVWSQLIQELDKDSILSANREKLLSLFHDRFDVAKRQDLAGLKEDSETYNVRLNALVANWKADREYCAVKLADHAKRERKGVIIVLDNTDQFSPSNQDYCFTLAHHVSTQLDCLVVISMREERFYFSKLHGTLDAFHNSGFHLTSPKPETVFARRLVYLLRLLDDPAKTRRVAPEIDDEQINNVKTILRVFLREFRNPKSHLNTFIKACAHGNMRLALDLFREFVLSGYTRVDEMIAEPRWTLQIHQVLRPMMVPYRLFYDERKSSIPNVFQIRSEVNGSHFTGLRVLQILTADMNALNPDYIALSRIRAHFADRFNMLDDVEKTLDVFLRGGLVESNNRIDEYDEAIDSIKITAYGRYIYEVLAHNFSYLDLVSLDCGVHDQGVGDSLANFGNLDRDLFLSHQKRERISARIDKVREFLNYLAREENIEREVYGLDTQDRILMIDLRKKYDIDETRVLRSANRNYGQNANLGFDELNGIGEADE